MDKPNSERAAFVSPYLNRRLRSVEEVMKARQRQEMVIEQGELEVHGSGQGEGEVRLRLVYSRQEEQGGNTGLCRWRLEPERPLLLRACSWKKLSWKGNLSPGMQQSSNIKVTANSNCPHVNPGKKVVSAYGSAGKWQPVFSDSEWYCSGRC